MNKKAYLVSPAQSRAIIAVNQTENGNMKAKKLYYHFTGDKLRDGRPIPPVGKWLTHDEDLIPCESGLHASERPFDALQYAPGSQLHLVELGVKIIPHENDKVVSNKRKIVASIDATELLRKFARLCALDCLKNWQGEVPAVVKEYLETGDESKRSAGSAAKQKQRDLFKQLVDEAFSNKI